MIPIFKRSTISFIALLALLTLSTTWAQPVSSATSRAQASEEVKLPDTPAGKTFAAFLTAFNSGDIEVMRKFHSDRKGNPDNAEKDHSAYKQTGGLKLVKVNSSSDYALEVLVETKSESRRLNFAIKVDANAPHAISEVRAQPVQE
jgi:hypothetical protein